MNNEIYLSVFQQNSNIDESSAIKMVFHQHKSLEISYVKEGYIVIEYYPPEAQEPKHEYISKGQFVVIKPNIKHKMIFPCPNETLGIEFSGRSTDVFQHMCKSAYVNSLPNATQLLNNFKDIILFTDTVNVEYQLRRFKKYIENININEYTDEIFNITIKRLLLEILQCGYSFTSKLQTNHYTRKAIAYINMNYMKDLKINDIAAFLGISNTYLQKLLKKELHVSVNTFINEIRIKKANELILNSNFSLKKISRDVGYNSVHTFLLNFKKVNNCTPSQYKTKNLRGYYFTRKT